MLKKVLAFIMKALFRVEVRGLENYQNAGGKILIIANHVSFLDAVLLVLFLPDKLTFAINSHIAKRWFVRPLLHFIQAFPLDPTNSMATKYIIQEVRQGSKCIIFPEGRITTTGALMKIYQGPALIAEKAGAKILPIHIKGAERSYFSKLGAKQKRVLFPKIILTILEAQDLRIPNDVQGHERRKIAGDKLYQMMSDMQFQSERQDKTLFEFLIEQTKIHGRTHIIAEDMDRKPMNYGQLLSRSFALGEQFAKETERGEFVGLLLPNGLAVLLSFFALQAFGRVPAMLNFLSEASNIKNACLAGKIKNVYTSHAFTEDAKLSCLIQIIENVGVKVHYVEEYPQQFTFFDKARAIIASYFPKYFYHKLQENSSYYPKFKNSNKANKSIDKEHFLPDEQRSTIERVSANIDKRIAGTQENIFSPQNPAVILFTTGSERTVKGVVLSHANIIANIQQTASRFDFNKKDILFNTLPLFYAFGLTGGTLLPLFSGVRTFFYPSTSLHRIVPELVYDTNATIMVSRDTFLEHYARYAHAYDFYAMRYIFAGVETLKEETRTIYAERFGVRIFEVYGTTETAGILSLNTPLQNKVGTVGQCLPHLTHRLEVVDKMTPSIKKNLNDKNKNKGDTNNLEKTIHTTENTSVEEKINIGRLHVHGANIMLGYLRADNPGYIEKLAHNTFDTGDMVHVDDEGFWSMYEANTSKNQE